VAFGEDKWGQCRLPESVGGLEFRLPTAEPDVVLTLHVAAQGEGAADIRCTSLAGAEVAALSANVEWDVLGNLRHMVSQRARVPCSRLVLTLPDATLLPASKDSLPLAGLLGLEALSGTLYRQG